MAMTISISIRLERERLLELTGYCGCSLARRFNLASDPASNRTTDDNCSPERN
jgi:hypothetical protein